MRHMSQRPLLVISGPSGVGKGTLIKALREKHPEIGLAVSYTTRTPRAGEIPDQSYHFISETEFHERLERQEFLEWVKVHDHHYASSRVDIEALGMHFSVVILEIDVQGMIKLKQGQFPIRTVFILPPSFEVLAERLKGRGSESPASYEERLETSRWEMAQKDLFDYRVINGELKEAVKELEWIIEKEYL